MQQQALAWLKAAKVWTNRKRPSIHRLLVATLIAPLIVSVVPASPIAQAATSTTTAPQDVVATANGTTLNVTWGAPAYGASAVTGYQVDYSTDGSTWTTASSAVAAGAYSYGINGLTSGTSYYVRVAAKMSASNSPWAYPWTKLYGTVTPKRNSSNNIVYESGYGLDTTGNQASNIYSLASFTRVRYKMQYVSGGGTKFNYVSTDFDKWSLTAGNKYTSGSTYTTPAATISTLAFPDATKTNIINATASNMTVESSDSSLNSYGLTGRLEIWANDYGVSRGWATADGSATAYDYNDAPSSTAAVSYGSFQVHDITNTRTVFAWNQHIYNNGSPDIGIGNSPTCGASTTDWTSCGVYSSSTDYYYNSTNRDAWKLETFINVPTKMGAYGLLMRYDAKQYSSYSGSGTTWSDVSGNGVNATLSGSLTTSSVSNSSFNMNSMQFNGTNQYATIGGDFNYDFSAGFSTSFYANFGNVNTWERIFDIGSADADKNILVARENNTQNLWFEIYNNGPAGSSAGYCKATNAIDNNTWTHWAVVLNGSTCAIYKNGDLWVGTTTTYVRSTNATTNGTGSAVTFGAVPLTSARTKLYIGRSNWAADSYFEGGIADLAIYNRPISKGEVINMMTDQKATTVYSDGSGTCATRVANPTGVTVSTVANDCLIKFAAPANSTTTNKWIVPSTVSAARVLVVGGGGGGGAHIGGGGGAGGFIDTSTAVAPSSVISITAGAGGSGGTQLLSASVVAPNKGANSSFGNTLIAIAGGAGASWQANSSSAGGSGGGGTASGGTDPSGSAAVDVTQGNAGGSSACGSSYGYPAGGGGGAGGVGENAICPTYAAGKAGDGGVGKASDINGTSTFYAGGGGGGGHNYGSYAVFAGKGGTGGGGNGAAFANGVINGTCSGITVTATAGTDGLGGGGGGAGAPWTNTCNSYGGRGGSGVVYVRYGTTTLSLSANSGTGFAGTTSFTTSTYAYLTLPSQSGLTRSGYTFAGWNTSANGNGTNYPAGSLYQALGTTTLYAQWNSVISYNANGPSIGRIIETTTATGSGATTTLNNGAALSNGMVTTGLDLYLDASNSRSYSGTGNTWYDLSGNGRNATAVGSPTLDSTNGAFNLNGTSQYFTLGASVLTYSGLQPFTFASWFKTSNPSKAEQCIICRYDDSGVPGSYLFRLLSGQPEQYRTGQNTYRNSGTTAISGTYYYMATTFDGTNVNIFVNGVRTYSAASGSMTANSVVNVMIGNSASLNRYFQGQIGVVQAYNIALTDSQILQNYKALQNKSYESELPTTSGSKAGYTFTGWATSTDSASAVISGSYGTALDALDSPYIRLKATDYNGSSWSPTAYQGTGISYLNSTRPTLRTNQTGWGTSASFSSVYGTSGNPIKLGNKELSNYTFCAMARWPQNGVTAPSINGRLFGSPGTNWIDGWHWATVNDFYHAGWAKDGATLDYNWHYICDTGNDMYWDGVKVTTPYLSYSSFPSLAIGGGYWDGSNWVQYADYEFTEIIVYDRALSSDQLDYINRYFKNTYGFESGSAGAPSAALIPTTTYSSPGTSTLYATWGSTITYDGNGATTGTAPATQVFQRSSGTLATNSGSLSLKGKSFTGWNTTADGTGTFYAAGASYSGPDLTLYALYKAPVKISNTVSGTDPSTLAPYMRFKASDYNATQKIWYDSSGNGRDTSYVRGAPTLVTTTANQNGSTKAFATVQGTTSDGIQFKNPTMNAGAWTIFSMARYNGTQSGNSRIFDGEAGNFLFGFYQSNSGVAHYNAWITSNANTYGTNWVASTGYTDYYRAAGVRSSDSAFARLNVTANVTDTLQQLTINAGQYVGSELSNWQVAELLVFDRQLSATEIQQVEDYLTTNYGITSATNQNTYLAPAVINAAANSVTVSDTYTAVLGYNNQLTMAPNIPGITLNTGVNTATINVGSTVAVGTYYETITATDFSGNTSLLPVQINVVNALVWSAGNPTSVTTTFGKSSRTRLEISGGYGTRVARNSHMSTPAPRGISIDTSTIASGYITLISDTGTAVGSYTESITVTDGSKSIRTILVTVTINAPPVVSYPSGTASPRPISTSNLQVNYDFSNGTSYSGSGSTVTDLSPSALAASLTSGSAYSEFGAGSITISPSNYMSVTYPTFSASQAFSKFMWVYLTSNSGSFMKVCDNVCSYQETEFEISAGKLYARAYGSGNAISGTLSLLNAWHYIGYSWDSTSGVKIYVDGQVVATGTVGTRSIQGTTNQKDVIGAGFSSNYMASYAENPFILGSYQVYREVPSLSLIMSNYQNSKSRFLGTSTLSPSNSGSAVVTMTEGKSATYQIFSETGGTGTNTFTLSGSNSTMSLASVGTDQTSLVVSSSITATNATTSKTYYETLTATDSSTAATAYYLTINVNPKIVITAATDTLTTTFGKAAYDTITASRGTGNLTFTRTSGSGSSAITSPVTGNQALLTAAATLPVGTYYETFTVTDSVSATTVKVITIIVNPAPTLTSATGVNTLETTYSKAASLTINVANGTGTRTASALPVTISGVSLTTTNLQNGTLVLALNTSVAVGRYTETITVTDSATASASIVITIIVNAAPTISYAGATSGAITFVTTKGGSLQSGAFTAANGTGIKTLTLSGANTGISIDTTTANTGVVTFGPLLGVLDTASARTYYETMTVTDSLSVTSTRAFTIIVNPPIIETATVTSLATTSGIETTTVIYASKGTGPITFTRTGTSTSGITLTSGANQATLRVLSTINPGTYFETITATDTASATTSIMITIVVSPPPSLVGTSRIETSKGVVFKSPLYAISGGTGTLTMSVTNSPSNANISLTGVTTSGGYLQVGSASETGTYTSTIRVTDARGAYSEIAVTVVVNAPVTLSGSLSITKTYGTSTTNGYSTNGTGTAPFTFSATPVCAVVKTVSGAVTYEKVNGTDGCTWTAPAGVTTIDALLVGAGGGGGGDGGAGGGGGSINALTSVSLPANRQLSVQVGAGGTGGIWSGANATNGGTTSVVSGSTTYTAPGGSAGGGCGAAASAGGATGSGGSPTAGGNGGYGATGTGCTPGGTGSIGSSGPSSSFTGTSVTYGGGGGGGPFPDALAPVGLKAGGAGGGGTGTQASGQSSYGLPIYFRALGSTPSLATAKEAFTTGTCGSLTGTIGFSTDSEFPCSQKDNFQGYATGYFVAPISGTITFYMVSDDSSQLIITNGGTTVIDLARTGASGSYTSTSWNGFVAGQAYPINVYFTEMSGGASWKLEYSYSGQAQTTIPLSQFRSGSAGLATYFRPNNSTTAFSKNTFTSGTCAQLLGNIDYANDAAFPCDGKETFQGYATGYFVAPYTGSITFTMSSDDSSVLSMNINGTNNETQLSIGSTTFTWSGFVKGQFYPMSAFFTEITGAAAWRLEYEYTGQTRIAIPTSSLRSNADYVAPTAGTNGLGGGGGAGSAGLYKVSGAQGGSGTVILKYATQSDTATETMITAYVNQESPSGLLTLNVPAYVPVGTYTETITVQDAANSAPYTATVRITVNKATPTATLSLPGGVTTAKYGTPVTLSVAASTPGRVTFKKSGTSISGCESVTATSGVATCLWTPTAVETASVSALLTPTDTGNYNNSVETATASTLSIVVGKADTLTITANTPSAITYSASMTIPTNGFTTTGLKSIDTITAVTYSYALTQGATCATGGTCVVGDIGPAGGVVIYVSATTINAASGISQGGLYLEAAPAPYSTTTYNWCEGGANPYTTTINASGTTVGTGADNTRIMVANCSGGAGYVAANLTLAGYSDWFLPSSGELALMSTYKTQIGLNTNSLYWGSTESSNWVAASLVTANGGVGGQNKGQATPLWPIRAFSPGSAVVTTPTDAGTYTITPSSPVFSSGATSNYVNISYNTGTLVINKAPRSTWSATYNGGTNTTRYGVGKTETATVTYPGDGTKSFTTSSSTCSVDLSSGTLTTLGVGSCGIQAVLSETRNWLSDTKTVTVTIDRGLRTATVTPSLSTIKYGDTTTVTSAVLPALDSATITYSSNNSLGCAVDNITGQVTGIKASVACSVRVTFDQTGLYESATATASITINKATAPVVTTESITAVSYTGLTAIVSPTYTVTGILARDIAQILPLADVSNTSAINSIAANTYSSVASYRYFATNPTSYDSTTAPSLGGTYAVSPQSLTLLSGVEISNYETPTYVSSNFTILPIAQAPLVIQLSYLESVTVPYDVSTTGGSSSGSRTLTILPGGTAEGCAVDAGISLMRLKTSTAGTCVIKVTQAADRNYLVVESDSQTVNILNFVVNILQLFDNPTGIVINHEVPFVKGPDVCTVSCQPTITQITDASGVDITTITVGTPFRIIGTNFTTATGVFFTAVIGGSRKSAVPGDSFQIDSDTQITVMPPATFVPNAGETVSNITVRIYVVASGGQNFPNTSITAISL